MKVPVAVLISDIHFSINTLYSAEISLLRAIEKANELKVPLIDCGDLTNDKAILRAECVNSIVSAAMYAAHKNVQIYSIVGNHSLINEKSPVHGLRFLEGFGVVVIDAFSMPFCIGSSNIWLMAYHNRATEFYHKLHIIPKGAIIIGHQGTVGGISGDYVNDDSAIDPDRLSDYRVFLGHYHAHFTRGTVTSVGNPYSLTFGEANDGPKGFLILFSDGTFERVLLKLPRHKIAELRAGQEPDLIALGLSQTDILWLKVTGTACELSKVDKASIARILGRTDFKLDKIKIEDETSVILTTNKTNEELMDLAVEGLSEPDHYKIRIKALWRTLLENN